MIRPVISVGIAALVLAAAIASPGASVQQTPPGFVDLNFDGTVEYASGNTISVRNPGGSFTSIISNVIPSDLFESGATLTTTLRFNSAAAAFKNSACGGRLNLVASGSTGACDVETEIITPFGSVGLGGIGSDSIASITGLELLRDSASGRYTVDMPSESFGFSSVDVNSGNNDSASRIASFDLLSLLNPTAGDFGQSRQGAEAGSNAGDAGSLGVRQSNGFGNATAVPEPEMAPLFGGAVLALIMMLRRRRRAIAA